MIIIAVIFHLPAGELPGAGSAGPVYSSLFLPPGTLAWKFRTPRPEYESKPGTISGSEVLRWILRNIPKLIQLMGFWKTGLTPAGAGSGCQVGVPHRKRRRGLFHPRQLPLGGTKPGRLSGDVGVRLYGIPIIPPRYSSSWALIPAG